jgi:hypothetical protein
MRLYNIFNDVILEYETNNRRLLVEGVLEDIKTAMDGSYDIWLKYQTPDGEITDRYIEINKMGTSLANNDVIRLYQKGGKSTNTKGVDNRFGWKLFRLDRIVPGSIRPTNKINYTSVGELPSYTGPKYNKTGDKLMKGNISVTNYKKQ